MKDNRCSKNFSDAGFLKMIRCLLLILIFSGCSNEGFKSSSGDKSKLTAANFLKIQVGMNHQDVKLILGSTTSESGSTDLGIRTLKWNEGGKEITVSIDNNGNVMPVTEGGSPAKTQMGLN